MYAPDFYDTKEGVEALKAGIPNADINTLIKPGDEMWLKRIVKGIGGSDAAAILNQNPFKSPLTVYLEKHGLQDPPELNTRMEWGQRIERVILEKFADSHPEFIVAPGCFVQHKRYPWLMVDPDALLFEKGSLKIVGGLEAKNVGIRSAHLWGEEGTDDAPSMYHLQCDWGMAATELPQWWLCPLIGGNDYREYYIARSMELERVMLQRAEDFMKKYVWAGTPPPAGVSEADQQALKALWPTSAEGKEYSPDAEAIALIAKLHDTDKLYKAAQANKTAITNSIMEKMGDAEFCVTDEGKISWRTQAGQVAWKKVVDLILDERPEDRIFIESAIAHHTGDPYRAFRPYWAKEKK